MADNIQKVILTADDKTKSAFDSFRQSVNSAKTSTDNLKNSTSGDTFGGMTASAGRAVLGIAGVALSVNTLINAVSGISKATIQLQQFENTLKVGTGSAAAAADAMKFVREESQRLGLDLASSAGQFAKLTAASKGTTLEGQATRDIFTSVAQAATVMGLSADQAGGALLAIEQMISKGTVSAEELRGQLGERLPGAFQLAARAMNVTTQELGDMLKKGQITAQEMLPLLAQELNKTFGAQAVEASKGLSAQMNRMNTAFFDLKIAVGNAGVIDMFTSAITLATRFANVLATSVIPAISKMSETLGLGTGIKALFGGGLFSLLGGKEAAAEVNATSGAVTELVEEFTKLEKVTGKVGTTSKKTVSEAQKFLDSLQKEADQAGKTAFEIKRMEAAKLGLSAAAFPLIDQIENETTVATKLENQLARVKSITEQNITADEKYLQSVKELNELLTLPSGGLTVTAYERAMQKAQDELRGTVKVTKESTTQIDQLWTQAGRNIQTTLANSIFNFFDDGLKGMLKNTLATLGRIASEFASLKLAQSIGLGSIFGGGGGTGFTNTLNFASLVSGASSMFKSGFGIPGLVGRAAGAIGLGGALGTGSVFAAGAGGAGTAFIGGAGTALGGTGLGAGGFAASLASFAGPAIALFVVDQIGRMLAGDKATKTFVDKIPVIGGLAAALFGRSPYKYNRQWLNADITASGATGMLSDEFKSKGGLFTSGTKYKVFESEGNQEVMKLLSDTAKAVANSTREFATNLGLRSKALNSFSHHITLMSERKTRLTEEQIQKSVEDFSNAMVKSVLPGIELLRKAGEDNVATFSRLNSEYMALRALLRITGRTGGESDKMLRGPKLGFAWRSSVVGALGGIDALQSKSSFFADNFLTEKERMKPIIEDLNLQLRKVGLSAWTTKERYKELVLSYGRVNGITAKTLNTLLSLAPAFLAVNGYFDSLKATVKPIKELKNAFKDMSLQTVDTFRSMADYNRYLGYAANKGNQQAIDLLAKPFEPSAPVTKRKGLSVNASQSQTMMERLIAATEKTAAESKNLRETFDRLTLGGNSIYTTAA